MNTKLRLISMRPLSGMALAVLIPHGAHAQNAPDVRTLPAIELGLLPLLVIGALLLASVVFLFVFKARFTKANRELKDLATELEHARQRFTETSQTLEKTEQDLKKTTQRYQSILYDAEVGMFRMDLDGKCTYVNSALQKQSGLYPKKALKEGFQSAIHPDDREQFDQAWRAFTKNNEPFALSFRFLLAKGREVHVACRANKIFNERKDVESYVGWVSDVTAFHEEHLREEASIEHYARFVNETIEGYYHLAPDEPIPLADSPDAMAAAIMEQMKIASCNETFAALYGASPSALEGNGIDALQGGCGPFKNNDSIKKLIEADYRLIDLESIRQDLRGNRLNLLNNAIGIVEDDKLVGIWGSHRNISQQKREMEELSSQTRFMHRILDGLPADVHAKDTRCRYLYVSRKLAERTGISQENWIGKTIFEVMPATPRDHDKNAIDVMKTGKLNRMERPYEARKKSGWMETIQIPLVSDDGLVEGVVGLSLEITERKKKEEEALELRKQLERKLRNRTDELQKSQDEYVKTANALRDTNKELQIRAAELETQRHEFNQQLEEYKHAETLLRRNEETLLTHQKQLEDQLSSRLSELEAETNKRKKWEDLLAIKENELQKLEELSNERSRQLEEKIAQHRKAEENLEASQAGLEKLQQELSSLTENHKTEFGAEHEARTAAESQLRKTNALLQTVQTRIQTLTEQHATELEHEVEERKAATTKLIQSAEELDELKHRFNERIEEATKALKKELAQKQIHEKSLRQQGKDLEVRIKELEKTLAAKIQENNTLIQAREEDEAQRLQVEQKLEQLDTHQKQLIERATQRLNLNIAEIRLEEVKLRRAVGDLQEEKEELETIAKSRADELAKATTEQEKLSSALSDAKEKLEQLKKEQSKLVAKETQNIQGELKALKQTEIDLRQQEDQLRKKAAGMEESINKLTANLKAEIRNRETIERELAELQVAFDTGQDNVAALIKEKTKELNEQIAQHRKNEESLKKNEQALKQQADKLQEIIEARTNELTEAQKEREKAELELAQVIDRSGKDARQIEVQIAEIKQEHLAEIKRIKDEHKELRQKEKYYRTLFQASADAFLQIDPKSGKIRSANLAAARLFGEETTKSLVERTIDMLSPKQQPGNASSSDMAKARLHSALESGHESFEWEFVKADKAVFHGLVSLSTIQIEEKELVLAVIGDISALKERQVELQKTIEEAHAANRMNSKVVDEVNETVKISLQPVIESAVVMEKSENLTDEQKDGVAAITRNCRTLIDTMNYRRELTHLTDGSDEVEYAKCDLHQLIKELDQQFSQRAETKKLFFAVSYAQYQSANNVPKFVETDEEKVRKTLAILLGYALAHTEKGRLGLHAARKSDKDDAVSVSFELVYTGKKKQDELLSQVFGADSSDVVDMKYGLTLVPRYVRMLGGKIKLEYREGGITALTLDFPFKKAASEIVMPSQDGERKAGAA